MSFSRKQESIIYSRDMFFLISNSRYFTINFGSLVNNGGMNLA